MHQPSTHTSLVGIVEKKGMYERNAHVHKIIPDVVDVEVVLVVEAAAVDVVEDVDAMVDVADVLEDVEIIVVEEDLVVVVEEVDSKAAVVEWQILKSPLRMNSRRLH
jgi:hypothetical protein